MLGRQVLQEVLQHAGIGQCATARFLRDAETRDDAVEVVLVVLRIELARASDRTEGAGTEADIDALPLVLHEGVVESGVMGDEELALYARHQVIRGLREGR